MLKFCHTAKVFSDKKQDTPYDMNAEFIIALESTLLQLLVIPSFQAEVNHVDVD